MPDLFGFELHYLTGQVAFGLIVAPDAETARLHIEGLSIVGLEAIIIQGQAWAINMLNSQYGGVACLTNQFLYS